MLFNSNKEKGRAGFSAAIAYFGMNGYNVSIPLNDTQDYDLIVEKDNIFQKVSCKATGYTAPSGNYALNLVTSGNGKTYGTVKSSSADLLFALTEDKTMYLIPVKDILNNKSITLAKEKHKNANSNTLDTSVYIVNLF